jgi:preprotein translocase subunit YajC
MNDRVLTAAGMYGTVVSIDPEQDKVLVRVDDDRGVRIAFTRASIIKIFDGSEDKAKDKDKDRSSKEKTKETA